jgi:hypothetical protein
MAQGRPERFGSVHVMEHHVGIDVSLELGSLCVLDAAGKVIREAKVASEPEALVAAVPSRK